VRLLRVTFISAAIALVTASFGGGLTDIGEWYQALSQPWFKPPDWAFAPAWTLIFGLSATAGAMGWLRLPAAERTTMLALFALNIVFNVGWTVLFFVMKRPDWSVIEVAFLWASVLALVGFFWPRVRVCALCLLPYLIWVSLAWAINYEVVRLNAPFG
jgi:tryptophan-rich sensory protein